MKRSKVQRPKVKPRHKPKIRRRFRKKIVKIRKPIKRAKVRTKKTSRTIPSQRYVLDNSFEFLYELRDLVLKSSPAEKGRMIERINKLGRVKLAIVSGVFVNKEHLDPAVADMLIVGDDIESRKLKIFLKSLEAEVGKEIKFAVMEKDEFQYRMSMFDRFIGVLLESPHEKLINKLEI